MSLKFYLSRERKILMKPNTQLEQLQYMLNSPFLKILVQDFPLPMFIAVNETIYTTNLSFRKLFGFETNSSLSDLDLTYFIGDISMHHFSDDKFVAWETTRKCDKIDAKTFCSKLSFENHIILVAVFVPITPLSQDIGEEHENKFLMAENSRFENFVLQWSKLFLGSSPLIMTCLEQALAYAGIDVNVFITGQKGTGKTFLANLIHNIGIGQRLPLLHLDCDTASLPQLERVFESILELGKSSLSLTNTPGVTHCDLYLENVDKLEYSLQTKIYEFINNKQNSLTSAEQMPVIRIISDTRSDLLPLIRFHKMDSNFFKLIYAAGIRLPTLQEHPEDIELLINDYLENFKTSGLKYEVNPEIIKKYLAYNWPGNIVELKRTLINYLNNNLKVNDSSSIRMDKKFGKKVNNNLNSISHDSTNENNNITINNINQFSTIDQFLEIAEKDFIISLLKKSNGKKEIAAKLAGMGLRTFQRRCLKFGI